jgi:hypothetical protein
MKSESKRAVAKTVTLSHSEIGRLSTNVQAAKVSTMGLYELGRGIHPREAKRWTKGRMVATEQTKNKIEPSQLFVLFQESLCLP